MLVLEAQNPSTQQKQEQEQEEEEEQQQHCCSVRRIKVNHWPGRIAVMVRRQACGNEWMGHIWF